MSDQPTALGYLRRDISGAQQEWDETQIRNIAKRLGYDLAKTLLFDADTDYRLDQLQTAIQVSHAEALIVPTLDHLGGTADPLVKICDVITVRPENTYARWAFPPAGQ
ncbi:hypothetical protein [Nocardia tenerifensis]|uniref:hypothetical protein n=1 Tax=Nocardia tenerifensis TaxID=228006 RepID=UPI00059260BF|nr:hypothetical protein [Nocardia tenerifensis]